MNKKWFIRALFLVLFICFGAFQEEVLIPNQQIVLEFIDGKINEEEINQTIENLKEKLLAAGVSNIVIKETENGALKISYFSSNHINEIKQALLEESELALNQNSDGKNQKLPISDYSLSIYELTNESDLSNLNDKYVLEIKYASERFTTNYSSALIKNIEVDKTNQLFKTAFSANKNKSLAKDKPSHQEPEVRAGPFNFLS